MKEYKTVNWKKFFTCPGTHALTIATVVTCLFILIVDMLDIATLLILGTIVGMFLFSTYKFLDTFYSPKQLMRDMGLKDTIFDITNEL